MDERHRLATESYIETEKKSTIRTTGAAPESFLFGEDVKSNQVLRAPLYKVTVLINKLKKKEIFPGSVLGN